MKNKRKTSIVNILILLEPTGRVELPTSRLRIGCSTTELRRLSKQAALRCGLKLEFQAENDALVLDKGLIFFQYFRLICFLELDIIYQLRVNGPGDHA